MLSWDVDVLYMKDMNISTRGLSGLRPINLHL